MTDFSINNATLIKGLKKGSTAAYTQLVDLFHQKLCVYAYSLTHDHSTAEDIVQNVFVSIWQKREKLKDDFNLKNYLYKSIYNQFIDLYRKEKATIALEKKYIEALDTVVEDQDNNIENLISLVKQEIQNLPPKCKQTFILSRQEGLTNVEIAEYQKVSIKTVEAQITKAFSIIRKNIGSKTSGILFLLFGKHALK
ncbi:MULTISPECIES: RNA polymerase sigma factor [Algibacter]|uniref:RNA polymerase ECF-type sigma factor n=1 Tax=Algibacter lectus TaxID=221126 RepID=A0A090WXU2_9FLAO|nr:RNA polymerase sigma-70 factor [Algibacter lectus]MDO7138263.1 RNA polymerase sigma-70 factor [Algibacter lectus]MWW26640.1 RNA polymerase sigma-70 factor [Algibacter lectus]TDY59641.1 RNA polymerase sigma-70 factor (ECF subfamily) [Algibacter lectus]SFD60923.1 RNA polymerase sigma-70 factor, ECF subfamily [Algibacter lectus]GAL64189.1 RNA polymerase ECF-type sigma factor [Algibacter lectus]